MSVYLDTQENTIYNLIKDAICKYAFTNLLCKREDIVLLAKDVNLLVNSKNPDICHDDFWYTLFRSHLKIESSGELNNLISYVKNHFFDMKNKN